MKFDNDDKRILNQFFTSSDERDTIYAAKETLPSSILAGLIGKASRAKETFREIFLKEYMKTNCNLHVDIDHGLSSTLQIMKDDSLNFLDKWKNHNSLRDVPHVAVFCDDLSILQTKVWEHEPVAEYQEKSTRYRPFKADNVYLPGVSDTLLDRIGPLQDDLVTLYNEIYEATKKRDVARYLLPVGSRTAMVCFASMRSLERIVGRMYDYPTMESQAMAMAIEGHIQQVLPTFKALRGVEDYSFLNSPVIHFVGQGPQCQVADVIKMENAEVYQILGMIDIGAHRDVQRHRSLIQDLPDYRAFYGYDKLIFDFIPIMLQTRYRDCMERGIILFHDVYKELWDNKIERIGESQYCALLGHMTRFRLITDLNRWNYAHDLRTGSPNQNATSEKTVHISYSTWFHRAQRQIEALHV